MTEFSGGSAEPKNSRLAPTRLCFILTTSFPPFSSSPHPQDVIPADVATGMHFYNRLLSSWMQLIPQCPVPMLTCAQRAVAPIAATLLAGGIALFPKKTAFAEEPRDNV